MKTVTGNRTVGNKSSSERPNNELKFFSFCHKLNHPFESGRGYQQKSWINKEEMPPIFICIAMQNYRAALSGKNSQQAIIIQEVEM